MYRELIAKLKKKGVEFTNGLTCQEIANMERQYQISFPTEIQKFYSIELPISHGFYNWKDFSKENVGFIKCQLSRPFEDLKEYVDEIDWCEDWEEEPDARDERNKLLIEKINMAPRLFPVYSHRYIACLDSESNPVFSIHGTDIIYYGENLLSYFEIEFGYKEYSEIKMENIITVPFWSDLI